MTHTVWCRGWHCVGDLKLHPKTYHLSDLSSAAAAASRSDGGDDGGGDAGDALAEARRIMDKYK